MGIRVYGLAALAAVSFYLPAKAMSLVEELGGSDDLWRCLIFFVVAMLGMLGNYTRLWARNEIAGGLVGYLFHDQPRKTVWSVLTIAGAAIGSLLAGQLGAESISMSNLILSAFTSGFAIDTTLNGTSSKSA